MAIQVITQGIKGQKYHENKQGYARINSDNENFYIFVDNYTGEGETYKELEKCVIGIKFPNGKTFNGTIEDLQNKIF
jgi:hypothetical protein